MRILLVDIYGTDTVGLAPQILAALADSTREQHGHEVETRVFSIFRDSVESIVAEINSYRADVVCFSCYIWNFKLIGEIAPQLDSTVVVGGPQVTGIESEMLDANPSIDIIVTGEGEATFLALLDHFSGTRGLGDVPGITTRQLSTPPADPVDLATIPPLFERIFARYPDITWVAFETSRGCPIGCAYCAWSYTKRMRYFPLDYVLSELDVVLANPRITMLFIADSSLLFNKKRALAILDHLIESGTDKVVHYEFSPDQIDEDLIRRMRNLPNNEFSLGLQTISPAAFEFIGRPFSRERFEGNYTLFRTALPDATVMVDLIYGLPGDDLEGYLASVDYAMGLPGISKVLTNNLLVLPGSRFYRDREHHGIVLAEDGTFTLQETATFTREDIAEARRVSFFVTLWYLNTSFKRAVLEWARDTGTRRVDRLLEVFDALPFELVEGGYPYMIPGSPEASDHRNRVLGRVLRRYPEIIESFKERSGHRYDSDLEGYEEAYTEQYYKYLAYAEETSARGGSAGA